MKGRGGSRIGQREKWNHDVVQYHFGQPRRVLWRDWCPPEPFCSGFAKSLGMVALGSTLPQQSGLKKLAAGGCLLTSLPPWAARPSLVGIQVITGTYLLYLLYPGNHHDLSFLAPHNLSYLPLFLHLTCQYLNQGPHLFSVVTEIASQLFSLTPFCPLLQCCQKDL